MKTLTHRILLIVLVVLSIALAGCNTIRGFGKDLEHLGKGIQGE